MLLGVLFGFLSYSLYAVGDAITKGFSGQVTVFELLFFINAAAVIPGMIAKPKTERWRDTFVLNAPLLMHARALSFAIATLAFTYALTTIPFAETYCLAFLAPLFVSLLSVIVLKEKVSLVRWILVGLSFVRVLIVVRPGFRELQLGHLAALVCAVSAATATTLLRLLSGKEKQFSIIAMNGAYQVTSSGLLMLTGFVALGWMELGRLLAVGLLGGVAQILLIRGLQRAPASHVGPTQYVQLLWGVIFGAAFYHETQDQAGYVGLALLAVAGVATIFSDGAQARVAGRWAEFRARRGEPKLTEIEGPEV